MTVRTWPDHLTFAKLRNFGCPYHGRAVEDEFGNGELTLPNETTIAYPLPEGSGQNVLVRGNNIPTITRTAQEQSADTAAGYQWRDYGLLSGINRQICGEEVGENHWLYSDTNASWIVRIEIDKPTTLENRLRVYLVGLFGYFALDGTDLSMTERLLDSYTWTPKLIDGNSQPTNYASLPRALMMTHKADGSLTMVNVAVKQQSNTATLTTWIRSKEDITDTDRFYYYDWTDAITVTLSGNGDLTPGSIGDDISCVIAHYVWADEMRTADTVTITGTTCYSKLLTSSEGTTGPNKWFFCVNAAGDITWYQHSSTYQRTVSYNDLDCIDEDEWTYSTREETVTYSATMTFGGESMSLTVQEAKEVTSGSSPTLLWFTTDVVSGDPISSGHYDELVGYGVYIDWIVHPNVAGFTARFGDNYVSRLISADGAVLQYDPSDYADPPAPVTVTHNPGDGTFYYEDTDHVKAGCFV